MTNCELRSANLGLIITRRGPGDAVIVPFSPVVIVLPVRQNRWLDWLAFRLLNVQ